jgi:signal transduction histidine kinase/integral membrane sensor domain MASE1
MQPLVEPAPAAVRFADDRLTREPADGAGRQPLLAPVQVALIVGLAYYAGSVAGLALRIPPATPSLMWPPNAILTAALLLVPLRQWWACFLGAFVSHMVVQQGVGWPWPLIVALFATNCLEALIGAVGLRAVSDDPTRFDTLKRVIAFVAVVGLAAPILSSFADAGVVHALLGEPFWPTWRTRTFANVLTELSVVPLIVLGWRAIASRGLRLDVTRLTEILALIASSVAVGLFVFDRHVTTDIPGLGSNPTVLLLPLFFWAGIRFLMGGICTVMLIYAAIACQAAVAGRRPFDWLPPGESVIALQVYLVVMALPMMCVAALLDERRQATRVLSQRLRFEELLSHVSAAFVSLTSDQMKQAFASELNAIGTFIDADGMGLIKRTDDHAMPWAVHTWHRTDHQSSRIHPESSALPWALARLSSGLPICCRSVHELPREAHVERRLASDLGISAVLATPLVTGGRLYGALCAVTTNVRDWTTVDMAQMQLVAEVFANALARKQSEDQLRSSETTKSAILGSLSSQIAVFDRTGQIIAVNEAWRAAATADVPVDAARISTDFIRLAPAPRRTETSDTSFGPWLHGLDLVLEGEASSFGAEYASGSGPSERWFAVSIVPLNRPEGGAVVSLVDISERKRAEIQAREAQRELAHVARVSAMGDLAASLAHQVNQPLAGILTNAQAARRLLDFDVPRMDQARDAIAEIIDDGRRAGDIVNRVREMMSRAGQAPELIEVNTLIRDVEKLMHSDAVIRGVSLRFDASARVGCVLGNRIDLQQVLLNLVMNAMDAVDASSDGDRRIVIDTEAADGRILVRVIDYGPGVEAGTESQIFEPFFTTKPRGMGIGLSLARSIVERHAGRVSVAPTPGHGATFTVTLPLESS